MLVVAHHSRNWWEKALVGSVAQYLIDRSDVNVVVLHYQCALRVLCVCVCVCDDESSVRGVHERACPLIFLARVRTDTMVGHVVR